MSFAINMSTKNIVALVGATAEDYSKVLLFGLPSGRRRSGSAY